MKIENILFLDIETVPLYEDYNELPDIYKKLWERKSSHFRKETQTASDVYERAGIYAEFGKIICISVGFFYCKNDQLCFRLKSFAGHDEKQILTDFLQLLNVRFNTNEHRLCAHNGKEFDFPYICRRSLINGLQLPAILDISAKKPWEVLHLDTMDMWKFGDYKSYTSLETLTTVFNIPTAKDDIDGSMVASVYYKEKNLNRIVVYCRKDVLAVAQIYLKMNALNVVAPENIEIID